MHRSRLRFTCTSANQTDIVVQAIMLAGGMMGTVTNAAVNPISKAFRIHGIKIWTAPTSTGVAQTCSVEWYSADSGVMTTQVMDTSNSSSEPAYISSRPPQASAAWYWRSVTNIGGGATTALFNVQCPVGSVLELDVTFILNDTAFTSYNQGVAAAVIGQMYYGGLDGTAGVYPPIRLLTTA